MTLAYLTFHAVDQPFLEMLPFFIAHESLFPGSSGFVATQVVLAFMPTLMLLFLQSIFHLK